MTGTTSYHLHRALGYQLSLTARLQERRFEELIHPLGLTRITWCVLLATGAEELTQPSDMAEFVGVDRTAISRALRQMETAGMVRRLAGSEDRRTTRVVLTDTGRDLLERATKFARANAARFELKLAPSERDQLHRLLAKLRHGEAAGLKRL